jgi:uncharacterized protein (TIGR03089 family)
VRPTTFPRVLADQCARGGSRPLVTFYDDATGERVELSVVTYANWVAKTAGLLQDELGLERGDTVRVDLPPHWLGPVWLGAAWTVGLAVTTDAAVHADVTVCGPAGIGRNADGTAPVVGVSLRPLGGPFLDPLPDGVLDYGAAVWGQPDAFLPLDEPQPGDLAWDSPALRATQAELLDAAATGPWAEAGTRLLTDRNPASPGGVDGVLGPLLAGGGTVWVANGRPGGWEDRARAEQVTARSTAQPRS